jgi:hypothetical protein
LRDEFPRERVRSSIGLISAIAVIGGGLGLVMRGLLVDQPLLTEARRAANAAISGLMEKEGRGSVACRRDTRGRAHAVPRGHARDDRRGAPRRRS